MNAAYVPKLVTTLRGYDRAQLLADVGAGVTVGVVALPLAIAFAIASGVTPQAGLYTAIIAGAVAALLGGSRVQVTGPTGAFVVIVYGVVQQHGTGGLAAATIMAGLILVALGAAGLGGLIRFVPHPVVVGFTSGIAVIIASGQLRDAAGLRVERLPAEFLPKLDTLADAAHTAAAPALALTALTVAIVLLWPRVTTRLPSPFVALVLTTALAPALGLPVETIGSRFGAMDAALPSPQLPAVPWRELGGLLGPAFAIAALGGIESLLSAVVADGMIGARHRSNMELIGQGVANVVTPLFGGIPATGAIARTATNVRSGGRTPVAALVHALTLLLVTLAAGRLAARIPLATLAGILLVVAYNMSEWRTFRALLRAPRSDAAVLVVTFALTVLADLTVALGVGIALAALLFIRRMAEATQVRDITGALGGAAGAEGPEAEGIEAVRRPGMVPDGVTVFDIDGPFFFGAVETFNDTLREVARPPRVLILHLARVPLLDASGLAALDDLARRARRDGTHLLLAAVGPQPRDVLEGHPIAGLAPDTWCPSLDDALARARTLAAAR